VGTVVFGLLVVQRSRQQTASPQAETSAPPPPASKPQTPETAPGSLPKAETPSKEEKKGEEKKEVAKKETVHEAAPPPAAAPAAVPPRKLLYFRANALGDNYGKLAVAPLDALDRPQFSPELACDRVHFSNGKGVCLASDRGVFTTYSAVLFDRNLRRVGWTIPLNGIPSRTRVSPTGRLAAITIFLSGHSYASLAFSTQTTIVEIATGKTLVDLEKFSVTRDGVPFQSPDFNFWGVTFQKDDNRFYATLWSKAKTYLVECKLAERSAKVIHEGVECPSLSPDNTRIAFKKRMPGNRVIWRIYLLDLKTFAETPLGETHNVDDQVEWLDNDHILYALSDNPGGASASTNVWVLPAKADGVPQILRKGGYSPSVTTGSLPGL
jgi:hypothetical protein